MQMKQQSIAGVADKHIRPWGTAELQPGWLGNPDDNP